MARIRNTIGEDRLVPGLGGRMVLDGQVVDVDPGQVTSYTQQEGAWEPADQEAEILHQEMLDALAYLRAIDVPEPTEADVAALLTIALTELGYREVIEELIPAATAEGLVVLLDIEQAGKARSTVLTAARGRLEELTGQTGEAETETDGSDAGDQPGASGDDDSKEG